MVLQISNLSMTGGSGSATVKGSSPVPPRLSPSQLNNSEQNTTSKHRDSLKDGRKAGCKRPRDLRNNIPVSSLVSWLPHTFSQFQEGTAEASNRYNQNTNKRQSKTAQKKKEEEKENLQQKPIHPKPRDQKTYDLKLENLLGNTRPILVKHQGKRITPRTHEVSA